jgi:hypothetical protein
MIVDYKYVDDTKQVVYCISDDGNCYVTLLVGQGHDPENNLFQQFQSWVEAGNKLQNS